MTSSSTDQAADQPKAPSTHTERANAAAAAISFDDPGDFGRAAQGLVATLDDGRVVLADGPGGGEHVVFDVAKHAFVSETEESPSSVHPSLWRQARLNVNHGLFEVADGVWQVRGYDIANITFLAGSDGWLIIDPLTNAPSAAAALDLANRTLGERPVTSIIYTHSHVDHFGGVLGVTSQEAVDRGDVQIVAPDGFLREVINEFVIAGPIMGRRAAYQFGPLLPPGPRGHVDCGLGSAMGLARSDLIAPTDSITETGEERVLSGIRVVFQNTPDAEAPAEMNFFFPDLVAGSPLLCMAENCTHTMHNLYPIRGAQTRDALAWSKYIHEALLMWGDDAEVMFTSHHWPRFGNDDVRHFLSMQRDLYRWLHDQTMRHANRGAVPAEISAAMSLPAEFDQSHVRGYYGTVSHNAKSVYNRYLGWYDGNPAHLDPLPPVDAGERYVEFMGGADAVLEQARRSFDDGDYRWVVEVVNHVVFADPSNTTAPAAPGRRVGTARLPVRIGHLAQRLPDGGQGATGGQSRMGPGADPIHGGGDDGRAAVRLDRRAVRPVGVRSSRGHHQLAVHQPRPRRGGPRGGCVPLGDPPHTERQGRRRRRLCRADQGGSRGCGPGSHRDRPPGGDRVRRPGGPRRLARFSRGLHDRRPHRAPTSSPDRLSRHPLLP